MPGDLLNVSDPLSALMIPAKDARSVCDRSLSVFDGQTRVEIKLAFNGTESFTTGGFTGESVICSAKFIPVSGYQKGKRNRSIIWPTRAGSPSPLLRSAIPASMRRWWRVSAPGSER